MLEQRRVRYRRIDLPYGLHPFLVRRVLRFEGDTVPALKLDRGKLQETRTIARTLGIVSGADEEWLELELRRLKRLVVRPRLSRRVPPALETALERIDSLIPADPPTSADLHAAVLVRLIECFQEVRARPGLELADRLCPRERYPGRLGAVL
jgi:hypothetical protein